MLPLDPQGTAFEGYISLGAPDADQPNALWVRLSGVPPGAPTLAGARLEAGPELAQALRGNEEVVAARLRQSPTPAAFFVELRNMLGHLGAAAARPAARPAAFFAALRAELDGVGWDRVTHLAEDLSSIDLQVHDRCGRRHPLRLALPPGYPLAAPAAAADLPAAFEPRWGPGSGLEDAVAQFEAALEQHQALWDSLDDLDAHAWVVEPAVPRRGGTYRRVALGGHVTLAVTLDPLRPGDHPECRFMGSDQAVEPLAGRLHANRARWRPGARLRENLEAVLEMQLPGRPEAGAAGEDDASADCAMCYAYRLPAGEGGAGAAAGGGGEEAGEVPDVNCNNAACGKPFHRRCLAEWLGADTTTKQSFGTLYGACPYCSEPIAVKAM